MDPKKIQELYETIDALPIDNCYFRSDHSDKAMTSSISSFRSVFRFLEERMRLASKEETGVLGRRMLRVLETAPCETLIDFLILASCTNISVQTLAQRIADLKITDPSIAETLNLWAEQLERRLPISFQGEFLYSRQKIHDNSIGKIQPTLHNSIPRFFTPLLLRAGREKALMRQLMFLQKYQEESSVRVLLIFFSRLKIEWSEEVSYRSSYPTILRCVLFPRHFLLDTCGAGDVSLVIVQGYKVSLFCRLVAAEIRDAPWPTDVFAPVEIPLHKVERDGKMVGVYSVGPNGIDDGGKKETVSGKDDQYFPLYGPQFPPKSATRTEYNSAIPGGSASTSRTSNRISRAP